MCQGAEVPLLVRVFYEPFYQVFIATRKSNFWALLIDTDAAFMYICLSYEMSNWFPVQNAVRVQAVDGKIQYGGTRSVHFPPFTFLVVCLGLNEVFTFRPDFVLLRNKSLSATCAVFLSLTGEPTSRLLRLLRFQDISWHFSWVSFKIIISSNDRVAH